VQLADELALSADDVARGTVPRTIHHRLRRIEQLTGADPRRFHTTLAIVLGLRTLEASRGA
jgi:PucR-like helix-turn-helix protein